MKIELTYKLKEGVRAADVDLNPSAGIPCRHQARNPNGKTVIQLFNNWFNVKVVLVETDGTKVVKDYASPDFLDYFTTKHNRKGPPKTQGSSFMFEYSRKFGEMSIKVLDAAPDESPVLIIRGHRIKGNGSVPRAFYLSPQESVKLPCTNDRVDDFFEDATGTYGTTIHCLDLNKEAIPDQTQMLEEENLKAFETKLAGVMSYKKFAYDLRSPDYAHEFQTHSVPEEAGVLNKGDCEATFSEIVNNKYFPERVNAEVVTAIVKRLGDFLKEAVIGKVLSDKDRKAVVDALNHKVHNLEKPAIPVPEPVSELPSLVAEEPYLAPSPEPVAIANIPFIEIVEEPYLAPSPEPVDSPEPVEITNTPLIEIIEDQSLADTIARLASSSAAEFSGSSEEEFNPDDLLGGLGGPSEPKRARVMAE